MNLKHVALCVGAISAAQLSCAKPEQRASVPTPEARDAAVAVAPKKEQVLQDVVRMKPACLKGDSLYKCPGFTGANFTCPEGWTLVNVMESVFPERCGPYML